jgi:hypothetical protein
MLRQGKHPKDAGLEARRRIRANTIEKRPGKPNGDPNFNITFYVVNTKGEYAGVAMCGEDDGHRGSEAERAFSAPAEAYAREP